MNYAIVEIGGSQYKVKKGDIIQADFSPGQSKKTVKINKVLMSHSGKKIEVGSPYISGASISCDVINEGRARKIVAYKYKRRKSSKFKRGHRQKQITLKIKDMHLG
jgi:large subunit ribosomal protein L21